METNSNYGYKVKFLKGNKIKFPDFILELISKEIKTSTKGVGVWTYYKFKIKNNKEEKIIIWSGGGDYGPLVFEFGENKYSLELWSSEKLGRLEDNELVIEKVNK